jgi:3-ketosteroid 9alpha-monooxygenase subunit B
MRTADNRVMSEVEQLDATTAAAVTVDLDGTQHRLSWPRDTSLVDMMLDEGIDVPHSCREGHCGSCVATVVSGRVDMAECDILEQEDLADGLILGCQARPVSAHVHIEF